MFQAIKAKACKRREFQGLSIVVLDDYYNIRVDFIFIFIRLNFILVAASDEPMV